MMSRIKYTILLGALASVFFGCQQKAKKGNGAASDPAAECRQRGTTFQWQNGACIDTANTQKPQTTPMPNNNNALIQQCTSQGGRWVNGRCEFGANPTACVQQPSFNGLLQCIQQNTQTYRQLLQANAGKVKGYEKASDDLDTLSEKASSLMSQGITTDMSGLKKIRACWDSTSMINQLRQMSGKLEFSDQALQQQSQTFVDTMHQASREIQNRINCPIKF